MNDVGRARGHLDAALERLLGLGDCLPLSQGILKTQACFRNAEARGIDLKALFNQTVSKTP